MLIQIFENSTSCVNFKPLKVEKKSNMIQKMVSDEEKREERKPSKRKAIRI